MLATFEVENFRNFDGKFILDLSQSNGYEFNKECVKNGIVNKAVVYGYNGTGKSNLGFAIFDIVSHATDKKTSSAYYENYLYAGKKCTLAKFKYHLKLKNGEVLYEYGKESFEKIIFEKIEINGKLFASIDRNISSSIEINAKGAENTKKDIGDSQISVVAYIKNNVILDEDKDNECFKEFIEFVEGMLFFRSLNGNDYIGYEQGRTEIERDIIEKGKIKEFESFIQNSGIDMKIVAAENDDKKYLAVNFDGKRIPFFEIASQGTKSLVLFYYWLLRITAEDSKVSFVFIDEFDAFYHHDLSIKIIEILKRANAQVVLTTHNTTVMTNDLLRPDCYFFLQHNGIKSLSQRTRKELRLAHNIEKMYRAGAFDE